MPRYKGSFGGGGGAGAGGAGSTVDSVDFELTGISDGQVLCYDGADSRIEACTSATSFNAQTGTSYTVLSTDRGKVVTLNNASAIAVTLPQSGTAGFEAGFFTTVCSIGAGLSTITPTTSTINGLTSIKATKDDCVEIHGDGTNYRAHYGRRDSKTVSFEGTCQNTTASFSLDTPTSNAPAAACITGSNIVNRAVLDFDAATDETVYGSFRLPDTWTGTIDLEVEAQANEASANVARLQISTVCVADTETFDPAFNAAQGFDWTGTGTANQRVRATQSGLTTTGCAAGERLYFKFNRDADATSGTDSLAVDLRVIALRFDVKG